MRVKQCLWATDWMTLTTKKKRDADRGMRFRSMANWDDRMNSMFIHVGVICRFWWRAVTFFFCKRVPWLNEGWETLSTCILLDRSWGQVAHQNITNTSQSGKKVQVENQDNRLVCDHIFISFFFFFLLLCPSGTAPLVNSLVLFYSLVYFRDHDAFVE